MSEDRVQATSAGPLKSLDEWDDFVKDRYAEAAPGSGAKPFVTVNPNKKKEEFRNYEAEARACVKEFYRLNHTYQTREFVLQTSEAARADGRPRWFVLTALIHDLGKILCLWGEPQWAVVGDTFPVGCAWSDKIVFHEFFAANPDAKIPHYQTRTGVYEEHCGLDKVDMSWGHDEYIYHVAKDYLPEEAHYMLRYHSFYPAHREGEYQHLMNDHDQEMFYWVREFNQYDLYSKSSERPNVEALRPYYEDLISEYFPAQIDW